MVNVKVCEAVYLPSIGRSICCCDGPEYGEYLYELVNTLFLDAISQLDWDSVN